jgi:hypothetical protein
MNQCQEAENKDNKGKESHFFDTEIEFQDRRFAQICKPYIGQRRRTIFLCFPKAIKRNLFVPHIHT